ncbi:stealth family protein [Bombilactobacillus folatiphilus]|uniref:Stealth family protein n=1 Tax=Bombilactobacillus folatiphilus TaxID=2923362 RepID=A0ABY4P7U5_9LACO|nr:stealth family protein [Bombilactobacillus folatiphilus]UQS81713.1 stealth family protein [Bombilactobacillus folatiphilus]
MKTNSEIDAVITWVDGDDPKWLAKKKQQQQKLHYQVADEQRYRDFNTLKYVFRSLENYAPWFHRIYLVTDQQLPVWLNVNHPCLQIVDHRDYIAAKYLPTFNSNVIDLNLDQISGLSENFILFNDDLVLTKKVQATDFFVDELPKDTAALSPICPEIDGIESAVLNNIKLINSQFTQKQVVGKYWRKFFKWQYGQYNFRTLFLLPYTKFSGFMDFHMPLSLKKSTFSVLRQKFPTYFAQTNQQPFRSNDDITIWLARYWQLCQGQFQPRSAKFGKYLQLSDLKAIKLALKNPKYKALCLNDVALTKEQVQAVNQYLPDLLEQKYPNKSRFEK